MPICLRSVEPSELSRGFSEYLPDGHEEDLQVGSDPNRAMIQMTVANSTLSKAMLQLVSLLRHADDIFTDLSDQCQKIFDRTVKINKRIITITENVDNLNSKDEPIPSGDLKHFHEGREPFDAKHGYDCNLFTSETRPKCVRDLYLSAEVSPSVGLSSLDGIRKDGWSGSTMFKLWPVVIKDINISTPDFNMSRKHPPLQFNKSYKTLKEPHRSQTVHSFDQLNFDIDEEESTSYSEDQQRLSQSQPSILVSIDTSGAGFERMCLFRRSLRELESGTLSSRCTRRRSISGLPESILQEIREFESRRRSSDKHRPRRQPRTYSFNDLGPQVCRDETFAKYFDEIDGKMEEKTEWENFAKQSFFSKFISCNRSRSLPRCMKSKYQKIERNSKLGERRSIHIDTSENFSLDDELSVNSGSIRRYQKRSSIIGDKIKNFIGVSHRPQRQSLNLDLFKMPLTSHESFEESHLSMAKTLSMPEGIANTPPLKTPEKNEESKSGQYYNFSNNTLPRAQAKKYDFPWESLPKDWTTSVRLREISKRRKEERQSSSGNWSGSTSARQSLESNQTSCTTPTNEMGGVVSSASFHSLGQDSGRDSATETDDRQTSDTTEGGGDETSTITGDRSDKDSLPSNFTRLDTATWLKSLAIRACSQDDTSSSSIDSLTRLTKPDFLSFDLLSSSTAMKTTGLLDDEVSSVYSLDQDGFYTSFHSDSGLKRNSMIMGQDIEEVSPESLSQFSIGSSVTVDSVLYIPGSKCVKISSTDSERDQTTPTREMSEFSQRSLSESPTGSEGSDSTLTNVSKRNSMASATTESSYSETDHEVIYKRLRNKTLISPTTFPSWCTVSSSGSDEDMNQQRLQAEYKEQLELNRALKSANIVYKDSSNLYSESSTLEKSAFSGKVISHGNTQINKPKNEEEEDEEEGSTLPRSYLASKKWNDEETEQTSSWPRTYSSWKENKTQGILKSSFRKESDSGTKMPKSLNFAPYVNMVEPDKALTQQCLLSDLSLTGVSYCSLPESNSFSPAITTATNSNLKKSSKNSMLLTTEDHDLRGDVPSKSAITVLPKISSHPIDIPKIDILKPSAICNPYNSLAQSNEDQKSLVSLGNAILVKRPEPLSAKDYLPTNCKSDDVLNLRSPRQAPGKYTSTFTANPIPSMASVGASSSTPYAISQVSKNYDGVTQGKSSSSFKISKPIVQKSSDAETIVINTSKSQANSDLTLSENSCMVPADKKRISTFLTQLSPTSSPESTTERPSDKRSTASSLSDVGSAKDSPKSSTSSASYDRPDFAITTDMKSNTNNRNQSYRVAMTEKTNEEPKRLDSYRKAITLSNKIVEDLPNRSDSYRVAMEGCLMNNCSSLDDSTNRSDSYRVAIRKNSSDESIEQFCPVMGPTPTKDPRRMGITDIEQLTGSSEDLFKNFTEKSSKSTSLFSKMFGNSKNDSLSISKSTLKKGSYKNQSNSDKIGLTTDKKSRRQSNGKSETGLQEFKKLVAQHSTPVSPKISAVEALKKKPSQPFSKESSSESGSKKIFGSLFQRPSSWGGTDKVNPKMSTYVSFDTIFEDKESISNASSIESLRSPSLNSIKKIGDTKNLHLVKMNNGLKSDRKSLIEANKNLSPEELKSSKRRLTSPVDEKAVQSVLDSIKTTIKSMTSRSDSSYKSQCESGV